MHDRPRWTRSASSKAPPGSVAIIGTRGYPSFYGGFETLVRKLAPFLADRGWQVTVYGRPHGTVISAQYQREDIRSLTTKGIESKSLSTLTFGATSILDASKRRPDVALVMNVANGYWLPMLRWRRIPSVVNVDGIEWQRDKWSKLGKAVFKLGAQLTARFGDILISDSREIGAFWQKTFNRQQRIHTVRRRPAERRSRAGGWTRAARICAISRQARAREYCC